MEDGEGQSWGIEERKKKFHISGCPVKYIHPDEVGNESERTNILGGYFVGKLTIYFFVKLAAIKKVSMFNVVEVLI